MLWYDNLNKSSVVLRKNGSTYDDMCWFSIILGINIYKFIAHLSHDAHNRLIGKKNYMFL